MSDYPKARVLQVPPARDEPDYDREVLYLSTDIGLGALWMHFDSGPRPEKAGLRGRTVLHRVEYRWELEVLFDDDDYRVGNYELRRDWSHNHGYATNAAHETFRLHHAAIAAKIARWVDEHPEEVYADYLRALHSGAHYAEESVNRDADQLAEKLDQLAELHREIARAEGLVKLEIEKRARPSALAS